MIDYWCNAFTPDREALWHQVIAADGLTIKLGARDADRFAPVDEMVERMDRLGIASLVLPVCELPPDRPIDDFVHYAVRPAEIDAWSAAHPGRFYGMWSVDPEDPETDLPAAEVALSAHWCVALHNHTHSWPHPFDHECFAPFYDLCARHEVPFVMQAGGSGGHRDHELGHPRAIAGPAETWPSVTFVLSHTGAPWVAETIAAVQAHDNVVMGTATHPPGRWPAELVEFATGPGTSQVMCGTGYPLTGHGHILGQLETVIPDDEVREALLRDNARRVFTRIRPVHQPDDSSIKKPTEKQGG